MCRFFIFKFIRTKYIILLETNVMKKKNIITKPNLVQPLLNIFFTILRLIVKTS
jgi:hypothetical protein